MRSFYFIKSSMPAMRLKNIAMKWASFCCSPCHHSMLRKMQGEREQAIREQSGDVILSSPLILSPDGLFTLWSCCWRVLHPNDHPIFVYERQKKSQSNLCLCNFRWANDFQTLTYSLRVLNLHWGFWICIETVMIHSYLLYQCHTN